MFSRLFKWFGLVVTSLWVIVGSIQSIADINNIEKESREAFDNLMFIVDWVQPIISHPLLHFFLALGFLVLLFDDDLKYIKKKLGIPTGPKLKEENVKELRDFAKAIASELKGSCPAETARIKELFNQSGELFYDYYWDDEYEPFISDIHSKLLKVYIGCKRFNDVTILTEERIENIKNDSQDLYVTVEHFLKKTNWVLYDYS